MLPDSFSTSAASISPNGFTAGCEAEMTRVSEVGLFERILVVITLLMFTGAIVEKFLVPVFGVESALLRGAWLPFYAVIFFLSVTQMRAILQLAVAEWPLL